MKLLYCKECADVFSLAVGKIKVCSCGASSGFYIDELNAKWSGAAVPLCFHNQEFVRAILDQGDQDQNKPEEFYGRRFSAWICPANSKTFIREE